MRGPKVIDADLALLEGVFARGARLTKAEARARYAIPERRFRAACSELRLRGVPIVAFSEEGSTYRLAASEAELEQFINLEVLSRAHDLLAQASALRAHARLHFPPEQLRLGA